MSILSLEHAFDEHARARPGCIILWPHAFSSILEIIESIERVENIRLLRFSRVSFSTWGSVLSWIYLADNSKLTHLALKSRYLRKQKKELGILTFEAESGDGLSWTELKHQLRLEFPGHAAGGGEHDHLIHMPDSVLDAVRLITKIEGSKILEGLTHREQRSNENLHLDSKSMKIPLAQLKARIPISSSKGWNVLTGRVKLLELPSTPHFSFLFDDSRAYADYLRSELGITQKTPANRIRYSRLQNQKYFDPIRVRKTKNGDFEIIDGIHRACISLYRNEVTIEGFILEN